MATQTSPAIALFVPEFFLYGYTAAFFTGSVWLGPALVFVVWLFFYLPNGPPVTGIDVFVTVPVAVLIGALVGALVTWVLALTPPLARLGTLIAASTRPKRDSATDNDGELVLSTGWLALIYAVGLLLILGPRLALWHSSDNFNIFTVIFIVGFAVEALAATVMLFGALRTYYLDARYLTYFTLYLLTPWLYSLLLAIRPWQGVITILGQLLLTCAVVVVEIVSIGVKAQPAAMLENDPRFLRVERYPARIFWHWMVGLYLPLFLEYLAGWIADSLTFTAAVGDGSPETVLLAVGIAALVIVAVLACVGVPRWFASGRHAADVEAGALSPFVAQARAAPSQGRSAPPAPALRSGFDLDKRN